MSENITAIYDKTFKRILTLSKTAVIHFINRMFDKNFPLDSDITYNWTENITDQLEKTLADTIITVNGVEKFHMEVQIGNDETMVLRVFDYGYQDARKYKIISDNRIQLDFPESKIIYLEHNSNTPDIVTLELNFKNQGTFEYKVPTMKFLKYTAEELSSMHMVIMMPLYLLKLRKEIVNDKSKEYAQALKLLIENDIIKTIEENEKMRNITHYDAVTLLNLLVLLYDNLYGDIDEFRKEGVGHMLAEKLTLYTEVETKKAEKRRTEEIAVELLKLGVPIDKIVIATKLPKEHISELKNEINQL